MASSNQGNAIPFKIVLLGDQSVGKTCLVNRYVKNTFGIVEPTLGQDFKAVNTKVKNGAETVDVRLQIWDTAGQEAYRSLSSLYLRGTQACILVYDCTYQKSFDDLDNWVDLVKQNCDIQPVLFLVALKIDLADKEEVSIV